MKKQRPMFVQNLRYVCMVTVILLGLMTIVGTGGGGGGGEDNPEVILYGDGHDITMSIEGCEWTNSTSQMSNIQYDSMGNRSSFNWSLTINNGNCSGETYSVFVHDIMHDVYSRIVRGEYDYEGTTYDIVID